MNTSFDITSIQTEYRPVLCRTVIYERSPFPYKQEERCMDYEEYYDTDRNSEKWIMARTEGLGSSEKKSLIKTKILSFMEI